ncbi:hypothetical protein PoB_001586000 [Plakobranchus ocellatus]|uniref:Uncharacterized protein n=1 Tax=Plakobranchus ocellatus TaxID=259542 RepID=A0AAV3Z2G3_9GAST|nr:hypothetical protein PoB_001586000 [Plakobranchus ocellatus]
MERTIKMIWTDSRRTGRHQRETIKNVLINSRDVDGLMRPRQLDRGQKVRWPVRLRWPYQERLNSNVNYSSSSTSSSKINIKPPKRK